LATELQNQDPTAPVDSTAMVGQMISLNQRAVSRRLVRRQG
jgi:flagellar basal-body rod modification protein FlgD